MGQAWHRLRGMSREDARLEVRLWEGARDPERRPVAGQGLLTRAPDLRPPAPTRPRRLPAPQPRPDRLHGPARSSGRTSE
jgi:hypothetical protein